MKYYLALFQTKGKVQIFRWHSDAPISQKDMTALALKMNKLIPDDKVMLQVFDTENECKTAYDKYKKHLALTWSIEVLFKAN